MGTQWMNEVSEAMRPDSLTGTCRRLHEEQYATMTHTERMALQTADPRSRLPVMFSPACKEHEISDADHTILTSHIGRLRFTDVSIFLINRPWLLAASSRHEPQLCLADKKAFLFRQAVLPCDTLNFASTTEALAMHLAKCCTIWHRVSQMVA